ncbi:MAG: hypothetical protein EA397_09370 [Deltaproteobacteria bacterium]|nr:MAG: hypothetical protein EA397_09370 [Deltaproteobacteria bacterium]
MADVTTPRPARRWGRIFLRLLIVAVGVLLLAAVAGAVTLAYLYDRHIAKEPGPHLERAHIMAVIAEESPVTYRDGTTRLGVFFQDEHRSYVGWSDLPPAYVASIVAAEDGDFWSHSGVSPKHIVRALIDNFRAGRTVSGGSTLTQQTAKNLYYRPDRSLNSKVQELLNALRLEAHYDKSEILTFYVNQFHVSGNGRGLGIAARYFFDAEVGDLDLLQAAFLAGLVKGPSYYDPFLGDQVRRERSTERAVKRTRYVLQRIVDMPEAELVGPWPVEGLAGEAAHAARLAQVRSYKAEAERLLDEGFELPFQRGQFRYDSNAVLDEVRRRLSQPPFDEVLRKAGVDEPNRAGLVVVTTLDAQVQREATYALWHHLTEVGAWLEKPDPTDFIRADSAGPRYDPFRSPQPHEFRLAKVVDRPQVNGRTTLRLDLGGHDCAVDRDGLIRAALAVERGRTSNRFSRVPGEKVDAFAEALKDGAVVWVSVREIDEEGRASCDLERRPELQGSVVVLQDGQIRAMVAGNDNQNFNRATARRQFGSTWKTLIYHAAMQLGWGPDEPLDNRRNVFPFSTTFYYPRPDHTPEPVVSMSWAGVHSENLASVWLLYHLTDRLDGAQVAELARTLDLARRADESEEDYRTRIQKAGVLPTRSRLRESMFLKARREVLSEIDRLGHPEDALSVASLLYGWGHAAELRRVTREPAAIRNRKSRSLSNSFLHLESLIEPCRAQYDALVDALDAGTPPQAKRVPDLWVRITEEHLEVACGSVPEGYVRPDAEGLDGFVPEELEELDEEPESSPQERRRSIADRLGDLLRRDRARTEPEPTEGSELKSSRIAPWGDVLLDERLHVSTFEAIAGGVSRRSALIDVSGTSVDLYAPEHLYWHQDFRVLLALRYVEELARQYGVRSKVRPVLALPLGANELTLEEATALYAGLITGQAWDFEGEVQSGGLGGWSSVGAPVDPALLIAEIRDVDGRILYRVRPEAREVAEQPVPALTADILRNVVLHGTGRRALTAIPLGRGHVPAMGKTGTTNEYRNAAFLGAVPAWYEGGWEVERGAVIGAYVGYDDNRPMSAGRIRLAGASGALPPWIGAANGMSNVGLLGEPEESPPPTGWRLRAPEGLAYIEVDPVSGLALGELSSPISKNDGAPLGPDEPPVEEEIPAEPKVADHAVLIAPRSRREAPRAVPQLEVVHRPERVAPSTEEAQDRARKRRELLQQLDRPQGLWD